MLPSEDRDRVLEDTRERGGKQMRGLEYVKKSERKLIFHSHPFGGVPKKCLI